MAAAKKYRITIAKPEDIPELNAISVASKMYWDYPEEWLSKWMDVLTIYPDYLKNNFVYKLVGNETIGFCGIENKAAFYEISHLWLQPEYIGQGLGKYLLNETLRKVVPEGAEVRVEADPNAENFYAKQGFITFDKVESYPKGRFLPVMKMIYQ